MNNVYFTVSLIFIISIIIWMHNDNKKTQKRIFEKLNANTFSINKRTSQILLKLRKIMDEMKKDGYVSSTENALIIEKIRADNEETLEDFDIIKIEIEKDFEKSIQKLSDIEIRTNQQNREILFDLQQLKQNVSYIQKNFLND